MTSAKQSIREVLNSVPDDATYAEIQYRIYVRQKVELGLADLEAGRLVDHEEVEAQLSRWLDA